MNDELLLFVGVPRDILGTAPPFMIEGFMIVVSEHAMTKRWVYPAERFWSYDPSPETERWCRFFGFGHEVQEPGCYQLGHTMLMHPRIFERLNQEMKRREHQAEGRFHISAAPYLRRFV